MVIDILHHASLLVRTSNMRRNYQLIVNELARRSTSWIETWKAPVRSLKD